MTIKVGDTVTYHRDPKEAAEAEAARARAAAEHAKAKATFDQVSAATATLDAETRDKTLAPLAAELRRTGDAAREGLPDPAPALVSFVHADGDVDVYVTGHDGLMQKSNVPVGTPSRPRDYVTVA